MESAPTWSAGRAVLSCSRQTRICSGAHPALVWRQSRRVGPAADGIAHMNRHSAFAGAVSALDARDFELLRRAVDERSCREKHGFGTLAEAADLYRPGPACPSCVGDGPAVGTLPVVDDDGARRQVARQGRPHPRRVGLPVPADLGDKVSDPSWFNTPLSIPGSVPTRLRTTGHPTRRGRQLMSTGSNRENQNSCPQAYTTRKRPWPIYPSTLRTFESTQSHTRH